MNVFTATIAGFESKSATIEAHTLAGCGHFMIEERPQFVIDQIIALTERVAASRAKELMA